MVFRGFIPSSRASPPANVNSGRFKFDPGQPPPQNQSPRLLLHLQPHCRRILQNLRRPPHHKNPRQRCRILHNPIPKMLGLHLSPPKHNLIYSCDPASEGSIDLANGKITIGPSLLEKFYIEYGEFLFFNINVVKKALDAIEKVMRYHDKGKERGIWR